MNIKRKSCSIFLLPAFLILFLILISSMASASTVQNSSSTGPYAYISNDYSKSVSVIDTATDNVIATVDVGDNPAGVMVTPDGKKVYVLNQGSNNVSVIDTSTNKVIDTINVGITPFGVAVSPDQTKLYVVNQDSNNVYVIDTATKNLTSIVNVGSLPHCIAVSPDGQKVYVVNYGTNNVSVISTATNQVIKTVSVGTYPLGIAITPDGAKVYVVDSVNSYTPGFLSVIDTATDTVKSTLNLGLAPQEVTVNPDGKEAYVSNCDSSTISVIDAATDNITATITGFNYPKGLSFTPDGKKLYACNFGPWGSSNLGTVSVVDTSTNAIIATVTVGVGPSSFGQFIVPPLAQPVLPVANFSTNVTTGNSPLSIQFTDLSENATEWNWSFGDGANSVEQNPMHTYSTAGNYTVTLTANNSAGSNTVTKYSYITVAKPDDAIIEGHAPLSVQFTDLSEGATEWNWNFGDGNTSTEQNPMHTYTKPGQYTVTLTANNPAGSNVITKNSYIITTNSLEAPVADFSVSTTSGKTPLNISFMDKSIGSPDSWKWSFGDGNTSTNQNPSHTYTKQGQYTVTLTVNNVAGSSALTKYNYIIVANSLKAPVADFSASTILGKAPLNVSY